MGDLLPQVKVNPRIILTPDKTNIEKILSLAKKDDLLDFLGLDRYRNIEKTVKDANDGKFTIKNVKDLIKGNPTSLNEFSKSPIAQKIYQYYVTSANKANSAEGIAKATKSKQMESIMKDAKHKYVGCIATKVDPDVYEECLYEYDNPIAKYEQYGIVPYNALRNREYENELAKGNQNRAGVLKLPENAKISQLPRGIRQFIDNHPDDFEDYLQEIKAESKYLDTIKKVMKKEKDLDKRAHMQVQLLQALQE